MSEFGDSAPKEASATRSVDAPWRSDRQSDLKPMTPSALLAIWEKEQPWKTPEKSSFKLRRQRPTIFMPQDSEDRRAAGDFGGFVFADKQRGKSVPAWMLEKLGISNLERSEAIDDHQAIALLADGLQIPLLHAALVYQQASAIPVHSEDWEKSFKDVLLRPDEYIKAELKKIYVHPEEPLLKRSPRMLFQLAEKISSLSAAEWKSMEEIAHDGAYIEAYRYDPDPSLEWSPEARAYDTILQKYDGDMHIQTGNFRNSAPFIALRAITDIAIADATKAEDARQNMNYPFSDASRVPSYVGTSLLSGEWGVDCVNFPPPFETWKPTVSDGIPLN